MKKLVVIAPVLAILVLGSVIGIYYYTSPPETNSTAISIGGSVTRASSSTTVGASSASSGYQDSTGKPQGSWAAYLGHMPAGYMLAPHLLNAPTFPCPPEMSASACAQFQQTCGNGVCDPNERCDTCPIDCAPTGNLVCDPYTGRGGSPATVCQAYVNGQNFG